VRGTCMQRGKRLECNRLAGAFERGSRPKSASKLRALQTLRVFPSEVEGQSGRPLVLRSMLPPILVCHQVPSFKFEHPDHASG